MFEFLLGKEKESNTIHEYYVDYVLKRAELTDLSIEIAANRIADVIAKSGFRVISESDTTEAEYLLNVRPNANQTATDFWKQAVYDMLTRDEGVLIVRSGKDGIFISDTFQTDGKVLKERKYTNVKIKVDEDTLTLTKTFKATDVVHLRYSNPRLLHLLRSANSALDDLFGVASAGFKARLPKVRVNMPNSAVKLMDENGNVVTSNQYAEQIAKKVSANEIKAIISHAGIDISTIDTKSSLSAQDVTTLRDSVFANTAAAFGIPKNILFGDVINQSNSEFITYACEPIANIINNALCGAWLTREEYMRGDRILVDMLCVKHVDVIDSAGNLDKLYQNGWSHNDILKLLKQPTVNEDWANMRRFTKNYSEEGGAEDEQ